MCGIAGIYNVDGAPPARGTLERMARVIAHRGPDGEFFYLDGGLGLAHRHLRIIDLSDAAIQPMSNTHRTLHLVFNGEIYNYLELRPELQARGYRFRSRSDSEVLLYAYEEWGAECLHRLNGMFAFAVWDTRERKLFIARDRMGVKPLYYWWDGRTFAFASEVKALLAHPAIEARPHLPALAEYMSAMYTTGEHTWFEGVRRLLPGHYLTVTPEGLRVRQWWDVPAQEDPPSKRPQKHYVGRTRELLEDSVRLRLRSDVPLGAHLSGGLDSSAVVALLSKRLGQSGERLRTFSGAFDQGEEYDERRYIRTVVKRYATHHHEIVPQASDLPRLMETLVWHMDEPAAGPGILLQWAVCELTRSAGVTVINGGQGGDEAWGGYFGYVPPYVRTLLGQARRKPTLLAELLRDGALLVGRPEMRAALRRAVIGGRTTRLRPAASPGEWAGERFDGVEVARPATDGHMSNRSPLSAAMYWDLKWYLPALLHVEDRTSMAFSLESRAPLLDYRLIEHAASVPSVLRLKGLQMKYVLREAVKDLLPPAVLQRRDKMGMPTPVAPGFRETLAPWVKEQLLAPDVASSRLLSPRYVRAAIGEHLSARADRTLDLWKMLSLISWWRVFIEDQAPNSERLQPSEREPLARR